MKWNYINILLFSLSLNILSSSSEVYNQRNHYITRTPKTSTSTLCECEMYAPYNYDNDPEMKTVVQDFDRQTSQRFEEYNERMMKNRQKCKEQCEKDIQKIILKDKIEKELDEKFVTLETNIDTNDIPACVCEKSLEKKTEKLCLMCGYGLGSNVPLVGLINGISFYASVLKYAVDCGIVEEASVVASKGMDVAIELLKGRIPVLQTLKINLESIMTETTNTPMHLAVALDDAVVKACNTISATGLSPPTTCGTQSVQFRNLYPNIAEILTQASKTAKQAGEAAGKTAQGKAWSATFTWEAFLSSPLGISFIVTVCIVVMLIIIYLILRYRRKKKMKRKLQYIKLLKE